jgi:hypothetical protein
MRKKGMDSGFRNGIIFSTNMAIFNSPPEVLTFSNWTFIPENLLLKQNISPLGN